ncbi:MAG: AraC family transcriptional regulator [Gemmatimonadota bacterium]|nr:AraC family transcriptional regulator [Gemmatimonadota bacterium]
MTFNPPLPLVLGYLPSEKERARITGALRGWARTHWVETLAELPGTLRHARGGTVTIVLSPRDHDGRETVGVVPDLLGGAPCVAIVAHCRTGVEHAADIRRMAEAGVHEFLFAGVDDNGVALRGVLASAQRACAAVAVLGTLLPVLPAELHRLAEYCVTHPTQARSVAGVAATLGVHRKTLLNHCVRAGAPPPAELINWCRLMVAAQLLTATGQTVEWVALELEFPSDTALRNSMKRYTGLRATDVRRQGGVRVVVQAFQRRLNGAAR